MLGYNLKYLVSLFFVLILIPGKAETDTEEQHLKVIVRMIGDEFLLQIGDSTSRVLPIQKKEGRYLIQFEKKLSFEPDFLSDAALKVVEETKTIKSFIIETENCATHEVVHSFEVKIPTNNSMLPCRERALPEDCYNVYFTILEYDKIAVSEPQNLASTNYPFIYPVIIGVLLLVFIGYWMKKKKSPIHNQDWVKIGTYRFDKKGMKLLYQDSVEELSSKETDLLALLFSNVNQTVKREDILQKVWDDEGDYLGRTLDVFISKLRKKLEADPHIKIVNIRGIGYRLVLN
ncbi:MAG: winged helix-turn-helix transcriptional regulator [Flavobacteriales bacterium]|nr:winged helix-turn-helix transcriptional regulator [Flavobacteriales bacterium]